MNALDALARAHMAWAKAYPKKAFQAGYTREPVESSDLSEGGGGIDERSSVSLEGSTRGRAESAAGDSEMGANLDADPGVAGHD